MTAPATTRPEGLAAYAAVTAAYWAFMLSDGALRMLVLLHFNALGFTPIQLAYLFLLYELAGFQAAVWGMAGVLAVILLAVTLFMPSGLPKGKKGTKLRQIFSGDRRINLLSGARMFLFGARDVWFVVGIPVYFQSVLSDGTPAGARAA